DGDDDLLIGDAGLDLDPWTGGGLEIFLQDDGQYRELKIPENLETVRTYSLAAGDLDSDGNIEILLPDSYNVLGLGTMSVLELESTQQDINTRIYGTSGELFPRYHNNASYMNALDIDQNGTMDIIIGGNWASPNYTIYFDGLNATEYTTLPENHWGHTDYNTALFEANSYGADVGVILFSDYDRDGDLDLFSISEKVSLSGKETHVDTDYHAESAVQIYEQAGNREFVRVNSNGFDIDLGLRYYQSAINFDVNSDGLIDVIGYYWGKFKGWNGSFNTGTTIFLNQGNLNFEVHDAIDFFGALDGPKGNPEFGYILPLKEDGSTVHEALIVNPVLPDSSEIHLEVTKINLEFKNYDYESSETSIYKISGVGHGVLADGSTYLTPLTDTKGNAWSSATPIGVEATSTGYNLITETVGKKGSSYLEYTVSSDGVVSKKGAKLTSLQLIGEEVSYNADLNKDGEIGIATDLTLSVLPSDNLYSAGPVIDTESFVPFDRSLDVYGLKLVAWPAVGGAEAVSDSFLEKTARTVTLLLDPNADGIESEAQSSLISGMQNQANGGATIQRIGYIDGDNYSPSILDENAGKNYPGLNNVNDTTRNTDYLWQLDETASEYSIDNAVTETIEHLLHTISQFGFPEAYPAELNTTSPQGLIWDAMQEAIENGVFNDQQYQPMNDGSNEYHALVMREYVYLLTYAEWDYINEFVDGGTLAPEWADNSRTPEEVAINNPLGHELYTKYISTIVAKPSEVTLKEIFSPGASSGYIASSPYEYPSVNTERVSTNPSDFEFTIAGKTYLLASDLRTFEEAEVYAKSLGGNLASVVGNSENSQIYNKISEIISINDLILSTAPDGGDAGYVWLGASDRSNEGQWEWVDGETFSAAVWGEGQLGAEPDNYNNQDYLALGLENWPAGSAEGAGFGNAGSWNDIDGSNLLFSLIEIP
ncbi:MAG: lectin-like protein, partial [Pseudomonadota bacterium]|nr:lectin-like protein [Pseudomonadota bacterium]